MKFFLKVKPLEPCYYFKIYSIIEYSMLILTHPLTRANFRSISNLRSMFYEKDRTNKRAVA